jgi:hypothetical protein
LVAHSLYSGHGWRLLGEFNRGGYSSHALQGVWDRNVSGGGTDEDALHVLREVVVVWGT